MMTIQRHGEEPLRGGTIHMNRPIQRHCEEFTTKQSRKTTLDRHATLAMTERRLAMTEKGRAMTG